MLHIFKPIFRDLTGLQRFAPFSSDLSDNNSTCDWLGADVENMRISIQGLPKFLIGINEKQIT